MKATLMREHFKLNNIIRAKVLNIFSGTLYYCCHTTCCSKCNISNIIT